MIVWKVVEEIPGKPKRIKDKNSVSIQTDVEHVEIILLAETFDEVYQQVKDRDLLCIVKLTDVSQI